MSTINPPAAGTMPATAATPERSLEALRLLVGTMIALAAAILVRVIGLPAPAGVPWTVSWWVLGIAFGLAEVGVVTIRFGRDSHTISLAEIPLVFGLILGAPVDLVVGRVLGSALALAFYRQQPPLKLVFNLSLFTLESAVAIGVYRMWLGTSAPNSPYGWTGAMLAVAIAVVTSASLVDAAIALHERRRAFGELLRSFAAGSLISITVGYFGLVAIALVWHDARTLVLVGGLVVILFALLRAFGRLSQRYDDLGAVYRFLSRVSSAHSTFEVAASALDECRNLLRAELADLVAIDPHSGELNRLSVLADGTIATESVDSRAFTPVRAELEATGEPVLFGPNHGESITRYFAGLAFGSGIVVPVESSGRLLGMIAVGNEIGPAKTFEPADVDLLKTLARQVAETLERAELLQRLQAEIAANQDLIRSKDSLIAAVSHEMRTPLTAVLGYAEILGEQAVADGDPERLELLKAVVAEAADLDNIVEDLLVASRGELGALSIAPRVTEVDREVVAMIEGSLVRNAVERRIAPVKAYTDPQRVRQIVRNLLENARRYGGDHIVVEVESDGAKVHVRICDDGRGVPDGMRDEMFLPYKSAHAPGTAPGSVGIGLSISRRLAKMMGGDIGYYRDKGWTVFDLSLPLAGPERPQTTSNEATAVRGST